MVPLIHQDLVSLSPSAGRMSLSVFLPPSLSPFHYSNIVKVNTQPGLFCRHLPKEVVPDLFPQYKDTFQHAIRRGWARGRDGQSEASKGGEMTNQRPDCSVTEPAVILAWDIPTLSWTLHWRMVALIVYWYYLKLCSSVCVTVILWPYLAEHLTCK